MTAEELQTYIYRHIPIVERNNFRIHHLEGSRVVVSGNYREHINHRQSVFGGSIGTIMTLAAWSQVRLLTEGVDPAAVIVIQSQSIKFLRPVLEDFYAYSLPLPEEAGQRFIAMYGKFGKARIRTQVELKHGGAEEALAVFQGDFVVLRRGVR